MGYYHLTARDAVLEGVAQEVLQLLKGTDAEFVAVRGIESWGTDYPLRVEVGDAPDDWQDPRVGGPGEYVHREDYLHELSCEMELINGSPDWHDDWQGDRRA